MITLAAQEMIERNAGIDGNGLPKETEAVAKLLAQREFNHAVEPPPLRAIYSLSGHVIATSGNLVSVTSAVKTGKSATIGAMLASVLGKSGDFLGFTSSNPDEKALLHFDSEQSPDDHWHQVNRALTRAGLTAPPSWFHSYCLTGLGCKRALECVTEATKRAADQHGGIHSILIDGIADLVLDVNDSGETDSFVAERHGTAIEYDCSITGVIHFNPGGEKTRGHLGSQFERKAESNLRLDKAEAVTTIWSDKQRRAPIPKGSGPCFAWSDEAGMHVSVKSLDQAKDDADRESLSAIAEDMFSDRPSMRYSDLQTTLKKRLKVSVPTAERRVTRMLKLGVIKKSFGGLYTATT